MATSIPNIVRRNPADSGCPYRQHLVLKDAGGSKPPDPISFLSPLATTSKDQAAIFGSRVIPVGGVVEGDLCSDENMVAAHGGFYIATPTDWTVRFQARRFEPAPAAATLQVSAPAIDLTAGNGYSQTVTVNPGGASLAWSTLVIYSLKPEGWLNLSVSAGTGPLQVTARANIAGLIPGAVYRGAVLVESDNSTPQYIRIPVTLRVPWSGLAVVNGASFDGGLAPGGIASVFSPEVKLAAAPQAAETVPLPFNIGGTSVTVDGLPAPLYYVSPGQVNLQVPYEIAPGPATLTVHTPGGQSVDQAIYVNPVAPGVFTTTDRHIVPSSQATAGDYATLFINGQGPVSPAVATGASPPNPDQVPVSGLPSPYADVKVFVAGVEARTVFVGIPYFLAGVTQVNFIVPPATPVGTQPVEVRVAGIPAAQSVIDIQR